MTNFELLRGAAGQDPPRRLAGTYCVVLWQGRTSAKRLVGAVEHARPGLAASGTRIFLSLRGRR